MCSGHRSWWIRARGTAAPLPPDAAVAAAASEHDIFPFACSPFLSHQQVDGGLQASSANVSFGCSESFQGASRPFGRIPFWCCMQQSLCPVPTSMSCCRLCIILTIVAVLLLGAGLGVGLGIGLKPDPRHPSPPPPSQAGRTFLPGIQVQWGLSCCLSLMMICLPSAATAA